MITLELAPRPVEIRLECLASGDGVIVVLGAIDGTEASHAEIRVFYRVPALPLPWEDELAKAFGEALISQADLVPLLPGSATATREFRIEPAKIAYYRVELFRLVARSAVVAVDGAAQPVDEKHWQTWLE